MPDEIDRSSELYDEFCDDSIQRIRRNALKIDPGSPGDCDVCGNYFARVVKTTYREQDILACGRCRDERKLR